MPTYVQHEILGRIPDVFNAEDIWQAPGFALFSRRPLLRDLLERCPREHRGRAATRCFSHVTLRLPQEDVDDDYHLTRGNRARELAESLAMLHQKDFGDLLGNDQVRYHVVGAEDLGPGEVEVRFGHAVYLPSPDEKVLFDVSVSRDGKRWHPVCPVYPNQRLALIGDGDGSYAAPEWPFGDTGAALLVNDGPDAPPIVQMRPKGAFDCSFDARQGCYVITARRGMDQQGQRLLLKVARAAGAPPLAVREPSAVPGPRPAVWQARSAPVAEEMTAVPIAQQPRAGESDITFAPGMRQRLTLAAIALPRLSRYRDTGAASLELPFDANLALGGEGDALLSIRVDADDTLYAGTERITAPSTVSAGDSQLSLLSAPGPMAERYAAILPLPRGVTAALPFGQRSLFGRAAPSLAALRVLDSPRYLRRAEGAGAASPDRMGLSRTAFNAEPGAQGLSVTRLSSTQALYHLDEQLRFVAAVGDAQQPYVLPPGHHLVAGHYVLRYDAS
ncbi:hypothetical protein [Massilia endophytica]|uniref:hypothetical protein n=1 Tax=Massilia endophytica TaxID=2899220 RepID=UPI001E35A4C8|nr:hypothetical protein [Massilia endophytica]UGQ48317.1 hypothetical protein LSQ66_07580 [Massilia endophytica]